MSDLFLDISRFLKRNEMPESVFGRRAANDPGLLRDLRRGREIGPSLEKRIRAFMRGAEDE